MGRTKAKPFAGVVVGLFEPETLIKLGKAYDMAIAHLGEKTQPPAVRDLIAERIISLAKQGEDDVHKLCRAALRGIALPP